MPAFTAPSGTESAYGASWVLLVAPYAVGALVTPQAARIIAALAITRKDIRFRIFMVLLAVGPAVTVCVGRLSIAWSTRVMQTRA
ncbi:hypothetical protein [Streptomyces sp. 8N616]|uniref:hypothetical protein n=1 Tax=Streptomyces sp. 8N616 TaxID=3457414 RepID=UPI003FD655A4